MAIPLDQLARFLGIDLAAAVRTAQRLDEAGLVGTRRFLVRDYPWLWLSRRGTRLAGTGFPYSAPDVAMLAHRRAVNEVRLYLAERAPEGRWVCERTVYRQRDPEDHLPDAVFEIGGERHAIEAELSTKRNREIRRIVAEHSKPLRRGALLLWPPPLQPVEAGAGRGPLAEARRPPRAGGQAVLKRRRRTAQPVAPPPEGALLGRRLAGERALPLSGADLVWPFEDMRRHAVILGASGSGKTETALRIAYEVARKSPAPVHYLDAKGDRENAERFCALMRSAGRRVRVFPNEPFDAWRGDWRGIANRLLEVIPFAEAGPAAYYRDIAKTALQLACHHPDGPPRCSAELLDRLDYERLLNAHGPNSAVLALPRDKVSQVRLRYQAFFGQLGAALDGEWSWEDAQASYLLLDSVALGEDAAGAASLLFADFAHYFAMRKPRQEPCLLFVDEFAAIAGSSDVAMKVEQARGFNAAMVLAPQTPSGMGPRTQRDRILGSVETVIVHALNEPDSLAELGGTRQVMELTHRYEDGLYARQGHARREWRLKVDPDEIRGLPAGSAWVIRRGRAAKVAIARAPAGKRTELPAQAALDEPLERAAVEAPKEISYLDEED